MPSRGISAIGVTLLLPLVSARAMAAPPVVAPPTTGADHAPPGRAHEPIVVPTRDADADTDPDAPRAPAAPGTSGAPARSGSAAPAAEPTGQQPATGAPVAPPSQPAPLEPVPSEPAPTRGRRSGDNQAEYPARDEADSCARTGRDRQGSPCSQHAAPEPITPTARTHDGFFLRFGMGAMSGSRALTLEGGETTTTRRSGVAIDILLGGTPWRGVVVGGGVLELGISGRTPLIGYSAFVQYYPDPTAGFHVQGLAAVALATGTPSLTGPLGAAGVGYDGWIGRQTSLGVFARLGYAAVSGKASTAPSVGGATLVAARAADVFGSASLTFTWH